MINVNYGNKVSEETLSQIVKLMKGESIALHTGISEEVIVELANFPGEKVLNVVIGKSIEEASRCLPDNSDEHIKEAAVLIKVNSDYTFQTVELATLIRYFDSYPKDPKITWGYSLDANQEDPVTIIILKSLINHFNNETY